MKIYVVRHGLTELNKQKRVNGEIDEPLAPEGLEQARAAISLMPKSIKHIYTSPMIRAKQTAQTLNSKLNLVLIEHQNLTEIKMGSLEELLNDIEHISPHTINLRKLLKRSILAT